MMMRSLTAEFAKLKRSKMIWWTVAAIVLYSAMSFAIAPFLGEDDAAAMVEAGGVWKQAAEVGMYDDTWRAGLLQGPWGLASGLALLLFAFIAAYVFGREFKERTAVQAFTTPIPRGYLVLAKTVVLAAWVFAWSALYFVVHIFDLAVLNGGFATFEWSALFETLGDVLLVTLMLYMTLPLFGWLAVWGKGYLRPMLAVIVIMGVGNGLATTDVSPYWPWNMPLHAVGTSWMPIPPSEFAPISWIGLVVLFAAGLAGTIWYVGHADIGG